MPIVFVPYDYDGWAGKVREAREKLAISAEVYDGDLDEDALLVAAFYARRLIEAGAVRSGLAKRRWPVFAHPRSRAKRPSSGDGVYGHLPFDDFDMEHSDQHSLSAVELLNQLIHAVFMLPVRDGVDGKPGRTVELMFVSDWHERDQTYRATLVTLFDVFDAVAVDAVLMSELLRLEPLPTEQGPGVG